MSQKGIPAGRVDEVCACEVTVIDANFSTFSIVAMGVKQIAGAEPISEQKFKDIKMKLKQCKKS